MLLVSKYLTASIKLSLLHHEQSVAENRDLPQCRKETGCLGAKQQVLWAQPAPLGRLCKLVMILLLNNHHSVRHISLNYISGNKRLWNIITLPGNMLTCMMNQAVSWGLVPGVRNPHLCRDPWKKSLEWGWLHRIPAYSVHLQRTSALSPQVFLIARGFWVLSLLFFKLFVILKD